MHREQRSQVLEYLCRIDAKVDLLVQVLDQSNLAGAPSVAVAANQTGGN